MDARIRARRIAVQRARVRRRRRALGGVLLAALLVAGGLGITRSSLFAITDVRVEGVRGERAREVLETAQVTTGQNLLSAPLDDALARTRALPWVDRAEVRREPPSAVVIAVAARRPVAVLVAGDQAWLVDAQAVVVGPGKDSDLPRIDVAETTVSVPGVAIPDPAVRHALDVYAALPSDVQRAARAVEAAAASTVRVRLALHRLDEPDGYRRGARAWVRLGDTADLDRQVTVLRALLGQLQRRGARDLGEIDVRVPATPVVIP